MNRTTKVILVALPVLVISLSFSIGLSATATAAADGFVYFTFLLNLLLSVGALEWEIYRRPISLAQIHWLFFLVFLVIAPWSQYLSDYRCWGYYATKDSLLRANWLLFGWGVVFFAFSVFPKKIIQKIMEKLSIPFDLGKQLHPFNMQSESKQSAGQTLSSYIVLSVCSTICFVILCWTAGFTNLFSKSTVGFDGNNTQQLINGVILRAIPLFAFLLTIIAYKRKCVKIPLVIYTGILFLLTNFPTSLARVVAAATFGGLFLILLPKLREQNGLFILLLLVGILIIFPAINVFRRETLDLGTAIDSLRDAVLGIPQGFNYEDYDAYSMFQRSLDYVSKYGPTHGKELLSSILFFVPRTLWPGKLYGSGTLIGEAAHLPWTRLSTPLPGEGVMNFGIAGVFIFAVLIAVLCRYIDSHYKQESLNGFHLLYPFILIFFFVIMRGELMSALSVTVGYTVVYALLLVLISVIDWIAFKIQKK